MTLKNYLILFLFLSLFIETTFIAFPLTLIFSILLYILYPETKTFLLILFASLVLDALKLSSIGLTSVFIFFPLLIVNLLRKTLEIKDYKIIIVFLFAASFIYAKLFSYTDSLLTFVLIFGSSLAFFIYFYKKNFSW